MNEKITGLADEISNGMFASRGNIAEAYEYAGQVAKSCGANEIGVLTAVQVVVNSIADELRRRLANSAMPTVVVEINGGAVYCARSSQPLRLVILDEDVEGSDGENVMKVNDEEFYVHDHQITEKAEPGQGGIDAEFVADVIQQIDEVKI